MAIDINLTVLKNAVVNVESKATFTLSQPYEPDGCTYVDVIISDMHIVVQHLRGKWGLTVLTENNQDDFTHKPEEVFESFNDLLLRVQFLMYVRRHNALMKEIGTGEQFLDGEMGELRCSLVNGVVVRNNRTILINRYNKPGEEKIISIQTGVGWFKLIGDMLDKFAQEMLPYPNMELRVNTIKEKMGSLRVYFSVRPTGSDWKDIDLTNGRGHGAPDELIDRLDAHVHAATKMSRITCEDCGEAGILHGGGNVHWLQTLCDEHAKLKKVPPADDWTRALHGGDQELFNRLVKEQKEREDAKLRVRGNRSTKDRPESSEESADSRAQ